MADVVSDKTLALSKVEGAVQAAPQPDAYEMLQTLLDRVRLSHHQADLDLIAKAFQFAKTAHENGPPHKRLRLTGEPYIVHPWSVALILAELGMDAKTIAAALLHDLLEDTGISPQKIAEEFGEEVLGLVEGVTKLKKLNFYSPRQQQAENLRKLFVAMAKDVRVIVIKLADRLHNMRTLHAHDEEKQKATATETLQIFAPLAHRLGIWRIKWELEDLAFYYLERDTYREISRKVNKTREERMHVVDEAIATLQQALQEAGIQAQVQGRPKHFYSIYQKMLREGLDFESIYDLIALRVIVTTREECYSALGVVHRLFPPIPDMFTDYIAKPKPNGYQALHTKVIGPTGEPMEVQIRTQQMHRDAEFGIAAHWRYKEGKAGDKDLEKALGWLRQIMELQTDLRDAGEFLESVKADLFKDEVFVFTPKGDVIDLPAGSTPVDFAYRIHTELGHRCIGAKVNGRMVPLDYQFRSGDIVEILASKHPKGPSRDWLSFVRTAQTKNRIKRYLKAQAHQENVQLGRDALERAAHKHGISVSEAFDEEKLEELAKIFHCNSGEDLLAAIGYGDISTEAVLMRLRPSQTGKPFTRHAARQKLRTQGKMELAITAKDGSHDPSSGSGQGFLYRLSRCCTPIPGDPILGYVSRGRGVTVHRQDCRNAKALAKQEPDRVVELEWRFSGEAVYQAEVIVEAFDRVGLLTDITGIISSKGVNIASCTVNTTRDRRARIDLILDITGPDVLQSVIDGIRQLSDVTHVFRVLR